MKKKNVEINGGENQDFFLRSYHLYKNTQDFNLSILIGSDNYYNTA